MPAARVLQAMQARPFSDYIPKDNTKFLPESMVEEEKREFMARTT